jgi:uncharacterized membrane protein
VNEFVRSTLWLGPALSIVLGVVLARLLRLIDNLFQWTLFNFTAEGARAILGVFIASMLTFVVLVASTLLLVVQLVSAQLTPRIILPTFRDPRIRVALSSFLFSYAISIAIIARVEDSFVPQLAVVAAIVINAFSVVYFVYFVMAMGMALRPANVLTQLAAAGRRVVTDIYPHGYDAGDPNGEMTAPPMDADQATMVVVHTGASGVLLAFDSGGFVDYATQHDAVIEIIPPVGDFVANGEALFRIYGRGTIDPDALKKRVAFGAERTFEQDPTLALRNIVDIANKALSPAINDPTTAVLAIDQIHRVLRWVGGRKLHSGRLNDPSGKVRLLFPTPKWNQFVTVACEEIRLYGADSPRILQRLRTMLLQLCELLPEARRPALRDELRLVDSLLKSPASERSEAPARIMWD